VPAPVISRESMDLVNDDDSQLAEETDRIDLLRD
jgi:hypothetical protein